MIVVELEGPGRRRAARVGDQDVEPAEAVDGGTDEAMWCGRIGDVLDQRQHFGPLGQLLLGGPQGVLAPGAHHDLAALFGQRHGRRPRQSFRGRRDQGDPAADVQVHQLVQKRLWSTVLRLSAPYRVTTTMSSMRAPHLPST